MAAGGNLVANVWQEWQGWQLTQPLTMMVTPPSDNGLIIKNIITKEQLIQQFHPFCWIAELQMSYKSIMAPTRKPDLYLG